MLRDDLTLGAARLQRRIYVELPTAEAHVHTVLVKVREDSSGIESVKNVNGFFFYLWYLDIAAIFKCEEFH